MFGDTLTIYIEGVSYKESLIKTGECSRKKSIFDDIIGHTKVQRPRISYINIG